VSLFLQGLISLTLKSGLTPDVEVGRTEDCLCFFAVSMSLPLKSCLQLDKEEGRRLIGVVYLDSCSSHTPCVCVCVCLALDVRRGGKKK